MHFIAYRFFLFLFFFLKQPTNQTTQSTTTEPTFATQWNSKGALAGVGMGGDGRKGDPHIMEYLNCVIQCTFIN